MGCLFRVAKATLYDQGTRVPLAIRWGTKGLPKRKVTDFVSLCDLAPTFLEAAQLESSSAMTGRSLLPQLSAKQSGQVEPARRFVVTGMEKHVYLHPSRALRTKDFLYVHNFQPERWPTGEIEGHNPTYDFKSQPWPTEPGAFSFNIDPSPSKQLLRLHRDDKTVEPFAALCFHRRPREELYDLNSDPEQVVNVASETNYASDLTRLRKQLRRELERSGDPRSKKRQRPQNREEIQQ